MALTNENLTINVQRLGRCREPVLVIDDFLADPEALVEAARRAGDWAEVPPGGYPGRRAGLPGRYVRETLRRLDPIIRARLFADPVRLDRFDCAFSQVTRAPGDLQPLQKLPHIDVASETRVAILHYLCGPPHGGTAFFRQERTGLERVVPSDKPAWLAARKADLAALGPEAGFADESTPGYTRIGAVAARFNRVAIYRSCLLHSGIIPAVPPAADPRDMGRLTTNVFVDYVRV